MPHNRFFCENSLADPMLTIEGPEYHHLAHVMRMQIGEEIELVNGKGALATATISNLEKKQGTLTITDRTFIPPSDQEIILAQALPRFSNLEWIIEKGVELGATQFWLFPGEKSEKSTLSENQKERLKTISISALKQSGALYLPEIIFQPPLKKWLSPEGQVYFGDLSPKAPLLSKPARFPVIFAIGPESGFSESEQAYLKTQLEAQGIRLHHHILRAETAGIAALSQLFFVLNS